MMPCVAKDVNVNSPVRTGMDRPKSIYKPKYHAFSIDSLVGNNDNKRKCSENHCENDETDKLFNKRTTPPPQTHTPPTPSPEAPQSSQHSSPVPKSAPIGHKLLNDTNSDQKSGDNSIGDREPKVLVKNGILRSYMTTNSTTPQISSHLQPNISTNHSNYSQTRNEKTDSTCITPHISHRFDASVDQNAKYEHILNIRSDINNIHNLSNSKHNSSPVSRNDSSPEIISSYGTGGSAQSASHFNSSQYYYQQLYRRPFDDRLIQANPFLPQVCDYKMLSTKSPDICCSQPSFNPYRKPKRIRTAFSPGQLLRLEEIFERNRYVVGCERKQLARDLNLSETQIKVWFQNRRTKHKREKHQPNSGYKRSIPSGLSSVMSNYPSISLTNGNSSDVEEYDHKSY